MRCQDIRNLIDLHLDGSLPEEMAREMERHLLRCADCAGELRALEQSRVWLTQAVSPCEASPAFCERTQARLLASLAPRLRIPESSEGARQWLLPFPQTDSSTLPEK